MTRSPSDDASDDDPRLRQLFAPSEERDAGFTWRVLTSLPPRRSRRRWRLILLLAATLFGALMSLFLLGGAAAVTGALPSPAANGRSLLMTAVILLALAGAALALVSEAMD